ncbi:MAG: transcription elongation factor Spt5 [Thaumarchaeota archaeon]|nr:transcription elongation factor Spt5 [Nitrososphaerota archaeon]
MTEASLSRFFAVKTTGGWEKTVTSLISTRIVLKKKPIHSILVLESLKGYIFVEADNAQVVSETVSGFKHVKSTVPGMIQFQDIEKFLVTKPVISEVSVNDIVEIVSGPFKGMKAKINRIEAAKSEVTVVLLDAAYQLPVTINANYLKIVEKAKTGAA